MEIAGASEEQSRGIQQMNQTIVQLEHVTQQNASMVLEANAAAASLSDQAKNLLDAVTVFRLGEERRGPGPGRSQCAAEFRWHARRRGPRDRAGPAETLTHLRRSHEY